MLSTLVQTQLILFTMSVNAFIYRLQHIPVVKKIVPDKCYKKTRIKTVMGVFSLVTGIIGAFIRKLIYFFVLLLVPVLFMGDLLSEQGFSDGQLWNGFCLLFLTLNLLIGSFVKTCCGEFTENDFIMIRLMRVEEKTYYIGKMIKRCVLDAAAFIPAMFWVSIYVAGKGAKEGMLLVILLSAFRFIAEFVSLSLQTRLSKAWYKRICVVMIIVLVLIFPLSYGGIYISKGNFAIDFILFHPVFILTALAVGAYAIVNLCRYNEYKLLAMQQIKDRDVVEDTLEGNVNKDEIAIRDEDVTQEEIRTDKFGHLKGYEYLNALFFARHKHLVRKKWKIKIWAISIISVLIWILMAILRINGESAEVLQDVDKILPFGIFLLYIMCSGENLCKAFFYHCDNSLLKYGYYRDADILLQNFRIRLRYLVILDLQPVLLMCAGTAIGLGIIGDVSVLIRNIPIFITLLLLSVFFDIYQLLLYYVFQPFLDGYQTKSAGYSICSFAMYYFCIFGVKNITASAEFTISVLVFTLICIPISYGLIYYLAPKRFKLR